MVMQGDFGSKAAAIGWCILRTSGGNTLPVMNALLEAGFDVWTPVEVQKRRMPRSKATREIAMPITPGIIFAREHHLNDLALMARSPSLTYRRWNSESRRMEMRGCPHFSVFRYQGQYPRVADRSLDPLRQAEQRVIPRRKAPVLEAGQEVRLPGLGFDGLVGTVQQAKGRHALVVFPGFAIPVQVEAYRLLPAKSAA